MPNALLLSEQPEYFLRHARGRADGVLANCLLLLRNHEKETVKRFLCHVVFDFRLLRVN